MSALVSVHNGQAVLRSAVPRLTFDRLQDEIARAVAAEARISAYFGVPVAGAVEVFVVLAFDREGRLEVGRALLSGPSPSLTETCPQIHLFERELFEQYGLRPEGHPWLKPVRFQPPAAGSLAPSDTPRPPVGVLDFYRVEGDEVHEVAVGPVHAGIIEPGHFRFQCHGEHVFHLEISLGYQHRGIERALRGGPAKRSIHLAETLAGDTTAGHATAYCQAVEALAAGAVPARAQALRGVALELERLANHTGDLGALAGDVGFLPTASYCGRLRGDFLNLTAALCGSRFGRGFVRPGGVGFDVDAAAIGTLVERLDAAMGDVERAVRLLWETPSVGARFENTGTVAPDDAAAAGLVGPAARASGLHMDVRQDFAAGIYQFAQLPVSTWHTGDVYSRAYVRWLEIQRSAQFVRAQLASLPGGPVRAPAPPLRPDRLVVSLVEGWRGEICHVALTNSEGEFEQYKVVDPSFHNWFGLALALRDQQISDFPLCNKSFNLSYCGFDL